jgi:pilus assembly protein CpaF
VTPRDGGQEGESERRVRHRFMHESTPEAPGVGAVERLVGLLAEEAPLLDSTEALASARRLAAELVGAGRLQHLLDQPDVTDVLVNGPGEVWVERAGRLEPTGVIVAEEEILRVIERMLAPLGLTADRTRPVVDARLADGARVAVVLPPLSVHGPLLAIRRHPVRTVALDEFAPPAVVAFLRSVVERRCNVAVYGATGAGKTTLLNALLGVLPPQERIVTIEDAAELRPPGEHVVRLEARPGTVDGVGRAGVRDLVRAALRLRPDRLVIGEVRGAEALDMVSALASGHDGSFATWHASGPVEALARLETLCAFAGDEAPRRAVRSQIHAAIDVLVGVRRAEGGRRCVHALHGLSRTGELKDLLGVAP